METPTPETPPLPAPDAPLEAAATSEAPPTATPTTSTDATYHISIWDEPLPTYACMLCNEGRGFSLEEVTQHLAEVHQAPAIPTPFQDQLLAMRLVSADNIVATNAPAPAQASPPPAPEETPDGRAASPDVQT